MRRHGLEWPPDPHQVGAFLFFAFLASGVYAFYLPLVEAAAARCTLLTMYTALLASVLLLTILTSAINPSDPSLLEARTQGEMFCALCQAHVRRSSKHCRACDRCVHGFDHHCSWLNNCVGAANYRPFFCLLCLTLGLLLLQLAWGAWLFARSFYAADSSQALLAAAYPSFSYQGWQGLLGVYLLLLLTALLLLGELFCFHAVLVLRNMTTYDFILAQRQAGGAGQPQQGAGAGAAGAGGAQEALCRSNQVADTSGPGPRQKQKVGLNPCIACLTEKRQPEAQAAAAATADSGVSRAAGGLLPAGVTSIWSRGLQGVTGFSPPGGYAAGTWPSGLQGGWSSPYTYTPAAAPAAPLNSRSPRPGPGAYPGGMSSPGPGQLLGSPQPGPGAYPGGMSSPRPGQLLGSPQPGPGAYPGGLNIPGPGQLLGSPQPGPGVYPGDLNSPGPGQLLGSRGPADLQSWQLARVNGGAPSPAAVYSPTAHRYSPATQYSPAAAQQRPLYYVDGSPAAQRGAASAAHAPPLPPAGMQGAGVGLPPSTPLPPPSPGAAALLQHAGGTSYHLGTSRGSSSPRDPWYSSTAAAAQAAAALGLGPPPGSSPLQGGAAGSHLGSRTSGGAATVQGWSTHSMQPSSPQASPRYAQPLQPLGSPQQPLAYTLARSPSGAIRLPPLGAYSPG